MKKNILIIVLLIVIGCMGLEIYNNKGKISSSNVTTKNQINENQELLSEDEVKDVIQKYLDLYGCFLGSPDVLLEEIGLVKGSLDTYIDESYIENDVSYIKTNIEYSSFKNAMCNYMTDEWFSNAILNDYFKNKNGFLSYMDGAATGESFIVEKIEKNTSNTKPKIESSILEKDKEYVTAQYKAKINTSPFFTSDSDEVYFSVENIDGNLVISECNLIFYPKY